MSPIHRHAGTRNVRSDAHGAHIGAGGQRLTRPGIGQQAANAPLHRQAVRSVHLIAQVVPQVLDCALGSPEFLVAARDVEPQVCAWSHPVDQLECPEGLPKSTLCEVLDRLAKAGARIAPGAFLDLGDGLILS